MPFSLFQLSETRLIRFVHSCGVSYKKNDPKVQLVVDPVQQQQQQHLAPRCSFYACAPHKELLYCRRRSTARPIVIDILFIDAGESERHERPVLCIFLWDGERKKNDRRNFGRRFGAQLAREDLLIC